MSDLTKEFSFFFPLGLLAKRWTRIFGIIPFHFCNFLSHQAEHKRRHSPGIILFYLWSIYHLSRVNRKSTKLRLLRPLELLLAFFSFFFFFSFHGKKLKQNFFLSCQTEKQTTWSFKKKKAQKTSQDQSFLLNLSKLKLSLIPSTIKEPRPEKNKRRVHTNVKQGQTQNMSYLKLIKPNKNTGCKTPQTAQKKTIKTH